MQTTNTPTVYHNGTPISPQDALFTLLTVHMPAHDEEARVLFAQAQFRDGEEARDLLLEHGYEFVFAGE
ncbi:MAG: hypothetical protein WC100_20960 [Sterolibacterium sp.]